LSHLTLSSSGLFSPLHSSESSSSRLHNSSEESSRREPSHTLQSRVLDMRTLSYLLPQQQSMTDLQVILNIGDVIDRVTSFIWSGNSSSLRCDLEALGCDVLWIFQKVAMLFVDTHREGLQANSSSLWVCMDELIISPEPSSSSPQQSLRTEKQLPPPSLTPRENFSRQKKRIVPTSVSTLSPVTSPSPCVISQPLIPFLCRPSDDYSVGGDADLHSSLLKCDHLCLTRFPPPPLLH
jgi:hypothetical protein